MAPEKKLLQNFLDQLSEVTPSHSKSSLEFYDSSERLRVILDASAYMAQLVENHRPRKDALSYSRTS